MTYLAVSDVAFSSGADGSFCAQLHGFTTSGPNAPECFTDPPTRVMQAIAWLTFLAGTLCCFKAQHVRHLFFSWSRRNSSLCAYKRLEQHLICTVGMKEASPRGLVGTHESFGQGLPQCFGAVALQMLSLSLMAEVRYLETLRPKETKLDIYIYERGRGEKEDLENDRKTSHYLTTPQSDSVLLHQIQGHCFTDRLQDHASIIFSVEPSDHARSKSRLMHVRANNRYLS